MTPMEVFGAIGIAGALLALLGHIVITLRSIHESVRKIQRDVEELADE